jgi:hypothetical protein
MSDKLILHRAKPDGTPLPDWEFEWDNFDQEWRFESDKHVYIIQELPEIKRRNWLVRLLIAGGRGLAPRWWWRHYPKGWRYTKPTYNTSVTAINWDREHVTAFTVTLPDGTEVVLPRRLKPKKCTG